jgi:hypothetical protein
MKKVVVQKVSEFRCDSLALVITRACVRNSRNTKNSDDEKNTRCQPWRSSAGIQVSASLFYSYFSSILSRLSICNQQ